MKYMMSELEILKVVGAVTIVVDISGLILTGVVLKKLLNRKIVKDSEDVLYTYVERIKKEKNNEK